jgi:molybdopterin synthase sulfur carrier subunit
VTVHIPSQLRSYTGGARMVEVVAETLAGLLWQLDQRYPGLRFRIIDEQDAIRPHIKIFVNADEAKDIDLPLQERDVVHIIGALSGG